MTLIIIRYYWEAEVVSYFYTSKPMLPFKNVKEMYDIAPQYRLAAYPDSADEDDFKYSSDPVWKKVYKELFLPHYQEYLDNPTYFYDMAHYYENSDGLALYNPTFIVT